MKKERTVIQLPELEGDTQIWVGQAILMLIRLANNNNFTYNEKMQHDFNVELMNSLLEELDITTAEIEHLRNQSTAGDEEYRPMLPGDICRIFKKSK